MRGYIVEVTAFDYNDEYYSTFEGAGHNTGKVYLNKEKAQERADSLNFVHATEVLGDLHAWCYGERFSNEVSGHPEGDVRELHRRAFPDKEVPNDKNALYDAFDVYQLDLPNDEDVKWFSKTFSIGRTAYVEEIEIETE